MRAHIGDQGTLLHRDPDECVTGRPAYDLHTRLDLLYGLQNGVFPAGGAVVARIACRRSGGQRHEVGRLYRVSGQDLLLCRYWFGRPFVRQGDQLVRTMARDDVMAVLLGEALHWRMSFKCPHRTELPVEPALVELLDRLPLAAKPHFVSLPVDGTGQG